MKSAATPSQVLSNVSCNDSPREGKSNHIVAAVRESKNGCSTQHAAFSLAPFQKIFEASKVDPTRGVNIEQLVCQTTGPLDVEVFEKAWQTVYDRHSSLRACFKRARGGDPYQEIQPRSKLPFQVESHLLIEPSDQEAFLRQWLEKDRHAGFNLDCAPLMRVTVLRWPDQCQTWVWTFHHILLDGRSFLLVIDELYACYESLSKGFQPNLPPRAEFREFIAWQEKWLTANLQGAVNFWTKFYPDEIIKSDLSFRQAIKPADYRQEVIVLSPDPDLGDALKRAADRLEITASTIVQGAWGLTLSLYYQSASVSFSTMRACRKGVLSGAEGIIGMLMNAVPVKIEIVESVTVKDFLKSIYSQQLEVRPFQTTPWEIISQSIPSGASKQISDSCILYERYEIGAELTRRHGKGNNNKFFLYERPNIPLLLSVSERPTFSFRLSHQVEVFPASTVQQIGRSFSDILAALVQSPLSLVGSITRADLRGANPSVGRTGECFPNIAFPLRDKSRQDDKLYWEVRLSELAVRPELPMTRGYAGNPQPVRFEGALSKEQWNSLRHQGALIKVSPKIILATAFADIIGKWSNQRRFTMPLVRMKRDVSFPAYHGNDPQHWTHLLAFNLDGASFADRARQSMARFRLDLRHRRQEASDLIREMRTRGLLAPDEEFPVVTTFHLLRQRLGESGANSGDFWARVEPPSGALSNQWINHRLAEGEGELCYCWEVREDGFPPDLIRQMFSAYRNYLAELTADLKAGFSLRSPRLPLAQQMKRIRYNDTQVAYQPGLLHSGFFEMSDQQSLAVAVDCQEAQITYGELAYQAKAVARRLWRAEFKKGGLVAVLMDKGWEQIATVLGVLRAGKAYLPIDPKLPKARVEYMLSNGNVSVVYTQSHLTNTFTCPVSIPIWTLENGGREGGCEEIPEPSPQALAYVIYTSGSTGVPKGVMISHQAALNTVYHLNQRLAISPLDRVFGVSSLSFDLSVWDIFGILGAGGTLILPDTEQQADPEHWLTRVRQAGVTIWNSAPPLFEMILDRLESASKPLPETIRWCLLSGDWIPVSLPQRLTNRSSTCRLLSMGGATEASIWSIAYPVHHVKPEWSSIPYGYPLENQSIHILDDRFQPCPDWVPGELYIGGVGLSMGYWNDPVRTEEKFVRNPDTGEILYRTGDYGRFRGRDGFVEFLGRRDTQIKVRGHRIELGEIESALLKLPQVNHAAVIMAPEDRTDANSARLIACIVLQKDCECQDEAQWRARLAEWLPSYMIPYRLVTLESLPISNNGKIDRLGLRDVVSQLLKQTSSGDDSVTMPNGTLEREIWKIWKELLPAKDIGVHDRFYDLGGDSALVFHMLARVEKAVGRSLGLRTLQNGGTISTLAAAARGTGESAAPSLLNCVQPYGSKPPFFFAHGDLEGAGLYCQRMSAMLEPDQPFHTLAPHGTLGAKSMLSIEEMARDYVELICSIQPEGPYYLGGYCNGGLVMYETAQRLLRKGKSVATLVLLDPPFLYFFLLRERGPKWRKLLGFFSGLQGNKGYHRIAEGIQLLLDYGISSLVAEFWLRFSDWSSKKAKAFMEMPKDRDQRSVIDLNAYYYAAIAHYDPQPYLGAGGVSIILREAEKYRWSWQSDFWKSFIPGAVFEAVSGTHFELRQSMGEIAEIIRNRLLD